MKSKNEGLSLCEFSWYLVIVNIIKIRHSKAHINQKKSWLENCYYAKTNPTLLLYLYQIFVFMLGHLHFFLRSFFTYIQNLFKKHPKHCNLKQLETGHSLVRVAAGRGPLPLAAPTSLLPRWLVHSVMLSSRLKKVSMWLWCLVFMLFGVMRSSSGDFPRHIFNKTKSAHTCFLSWVEMQWPSCIISKQLLEEKTFHLIK